MAAEIEIKLEVPALSAQRLLKRPWLRQLECGAAERRRLVSVYYDTQKRKLRRNGVSLRVRRDGGKYVQTVKADPRGAKGPFGRAEWETGIDHPRPDRSLAQGTALDCFKRKKLWRGLRPVFATDITRVAMPLRLGGSEIEVALDRGTVKAGRKHAPISEIELELKRGDPVQLVTLGERIARETGAAYGSMSKAESGYDLIAGAQPQVVRTERIDLDPGATVGDAFQIIALSCLRHVDANRDAVRRGLPEGVHQMRVGLRRLRAAISFFKELLQDAESMSIKGELKWLRGELGLARDLDVFISESVEPLQQERVDGTALATLKTDLAHRREHGFERAKSAVASERYRKAILNTAFWIMGGKWTIATNNSSIAETRNCEITDFANHEIARRHRKIVKRLKKLEEIDPRARHKLRIAIKKLRYADEFFSNLYSDRRRERRLEQHRAILKQLQSGLGKLNDLQIHDKMAKMIESEHRTPQKSQKSFAMGMISGRDHARVRSLMAATDKSRRRLSRMRAFWT
jgi:inorganic triphosphatase YgiF